MNPKVSVILPNYNRERYIGEAIESVLNQTYRNLELIVVDDGSTDNSLEVVARYKDDRLKIIRIQHNGFPGAVRNYGIKASKGEYIAFIDSDDVWDNDKLSIKMEQFRNNNQLDFLHSDLELIDENDNPMGKTWHKTESSRLIDYRTGDCFAQMLKGGCCIVPTSVLFRRKIIDKIGLFEESLEVCEDPHFFLKVARFFKIGFIDRPLGKYRIHPGNAHKSIALQSEHPMIRVLNLITKLYPEIKYQYKRLLKKRYYGLYLTNARQLFEAGRLKEARIHFLRGMSVYPFSVAPYLFYLLTFLDVSSATRLRRVLRNIRSRLYGAAKA